jgi:hypothetical protein
LQEAVEVAAFDSATLSAEDQAKVVLKWKRALRALELGFRVRGLGVRV